MPDGHRTAGGRVPQSEPFPACKIDPEIHNESAVRQSGDGLGFECTHPADRRPGSPHQLHRGAADSGVMRKEITDPVILRFPGVNVRENRGGFHKFPRVIGSGKDVIPGTHFGNQHGVFAPGGLVPVPDTADLAGVPAFCKVDGEGVFPHPEQRRHIINLILDPFIVIRPAGSEAIFRDRFAIDFRFIKPQCGNVDPGIGRNFIQLECASGTLHWQAVGTGSPPGDPLRFPCRTHHPGFKKRLRRSRVPGIIGHLQLPPVTRPRRQRHPGIFDLRGFIAVNRTAVPDRFPGKNIRNHDPAGHLFFGRTGKSVAKTGTGFIHPHRINFIFRQHP